MSSLADWFSNVVTALKNLPALIFSAFETALTGIKEAISALFDLLGTVGGLVFDAFKDILTNIVDGVLSIPEKVGEFFTNLMDFITGIFVPKQEDIDGAMNKLKTEFGKLCYTYNLKSLVGGTKPMQDISCTLYGQTVVIVRFDALKTVLNWVRPVIRGFIVLLLVLFNINQFLGFIGQPAISIVGMIKQSSGEESAQK